MQWMVAMGLALWRGCVAALLLFSTSGSVAVPLYALVEMWICTLCVLNALGAQRVDERPIGWFLPVLYMAGAVVVPIGAGGWLAEVALLIALPLRVWSVWSLGISCSAGTATFENLVECGPYRFVRHPMQASGLLARVALALAFPHWWNWLGVLLMAVAEVGVVWLEESFLRQFDSWCQYSRRVHYRLLPRVW